MRIQFDFRSDATTEQIRTLDSRIQRMMLRDWPSDMARDPVLLKSFIFLPLGESVQSGCRAKITPPPPPPEVTAEESFLDSLSGVIPGGLYFPSDERTLGKMLDTFSVVEMNFGGQGSREVTWGPNIAISPSPTPSSNFSDSSKGGNAVVFFFTSMSGIQLNLG